MTGEIFDTLQEPRGVFISYSHKDKHQWIDRLRAHLEPLTRDRHNVQIWDDSRIQAGACWQEEISNALRTARVAVLLISANFFASEYIWKSELPALLEAAENQGTVILPVLVSASRFGRTPELAKYQSVNNPTTPLTDLPFGEQETVFDLLARRIESLLVTARRIAPDETATQSVHDESAGSLPSTVCRESILKHAANMGVSVGPVVGAPVSPLGTRSYRALENDGKGVIYCHANGRYKGTSFHVRKGIGWLYERVLLGVSSRLGLPVSDEHLDRDTGRPTSRFECGYIEWSATSKIARAVLSGGDGDISLVERVL